VIFLSEHLFGNQLQLKRFSVLQSNVFIYINTMATRLMKELKTLQMNPPEDMVLLPSDSNLYHWTAVIKGPRDTPYEGGYFQLSISIPDTYPLQPPSVRFNTKVFHPNIHFKTGEICLDLFKNAWSAVHTLQSVCTCILLLLSTPEPDSPLNCDCGNLLRCGDIRGYNSLASMYTKLYATSKNIINVDMYRSYNKNFV